MCTVHLPAWSSAGLSLKPKNVHAPILRANLLQQSRLWPSSCRVRSLNTEVGHISQIGVSVDGASSVFSSFGFFFNNRRIKRIN